MASAANRQALFIRHTLANQVSCARRHIVHLAPAAILYIQVAKLLAISA